LLLGSPFGRSAKTNLRFWVLDCAIDGFLN
jgi:hypothetical protein